MSRRTRRLGRRWPGGLLLATVGALLCCRSSSSRRALRALRTLATEHSWHKTGRFLHFTMRGTGVAVRAVTKMRRLNAVSGGSGRANPTHSKSRGGESMAVDAQIAVKRLELRHEGADIARQRQCDGDIERRVLGYLSFRGIEGLEFLTISVSRGNVALSGIVSSSCAKRRLYECCRSVAGVLNVSDRHVALRGHRLEERAGIRKSASTNSFTRLKNR